MKKIEDIIIAMLDSLAYELIAAYRDYFPKNDTADFWIILKTYIIRWYLIRKKRRIKKDGN